MSETASGEKTVKELKTLFPQIAASIIGASYNIVVGISLSYSAILIPQLLEAKHDLKITKSESLWLASCFPIMAPLGGITGGFMIDTMGRLNVLRLSSVPFAAGWLLIALSSSFPVLLLGRIVTSVASAWGTSASIVYITEISRADLRGSLTSITTIFLTLGSLVVYLKGCFLNWRAIAWLCMGYSAVLLIILLLIPESPPWLVSKGKTFQAKRSLKWFHKYQPLKEPVSYAEVQLTLLQKEHEIKQEKQRELIKQSGLLKLLKTLLLPSAYKPVLILSGLSFFQQFTGIFVVLFHGVIFFKDISTNIDPYLAMAILGIIRLVMAVVSTWTMSRYRRRSLFMASAAGMGLCMGTSAFFTSWIQRGLTTQYWIPILMIVMYTTTSMIGVLPIPLTISAELFPISIRGMGNNIIFITRNLMMFAVLHSFYDLREALGGASGIQWFFSAICFASVAVSYVFMPETHNKKLEDIEEYFWHHTTYLSVIYRKQTKEKNVANRTENLKELV